ncbi:MULTISPECIES: ParB/RepB/Spo0J family partition protein [unclassified Streptomyces]|uniref:ParB/RepB/Spo0J family partition protein n=1 Tax=unclassified Streptomyces TaxID=2593676 RepID=UPI0003C99797|nr:MULTISPECIES: ParB N-terminal domain-containing protein [unclassified Streptomyces]AGZ94430.1 streptomycin biosynthesis operon possible regulatory protein [Streptomyces sp. NRRL B-16215]
MTILVISGGESEENAECLDPGGRTGVTAPDSDSAGDVVKIDTARLVPADSPRLTGLNQEHVKLMAESGQELPPIIVHRLTMRVIDGMHRLQAAVLRGDKRIRIRFFEGSPEEAFVLSVKANNAHGLPLTTEDRRAAAQRLLASHPEWSDRVVAEVVGLSAHTVAAVRRSTEEIPQLNGRVGRDGRFRPNSTADARRRAGELMRQRPEASLRQISKETGLSLGTVTDVKRRVERGENPVPAGRSWKGGEADRRTRPAPEVSPAGVQSLGLKNSWRRLSRDPSLKYSRGGRQLLRLLSAHAIVSEIADVVPRHCARNVALLARECAEAWNQLACRLESAEQNGDASQKAVPVSQERALA